MRVPKAYVQKEWIKECAEFFNFSHSYSFIFPWEFLDVKISL
jgi:hypothetical protein